MKILVTGCCGYIGSTLVNKLVERFPHDDIIGVDNFLYNNNFVLNKINPRVCVFEMDCCSFEIVKLYRRSDVIVHLAAIVGQPACDINKALTWQVNVGATDHLLTSINDKQKVIFANTNSGYGTRDSECYETDELTPISAYGVTKKIAEEMVLTRPNSCSFRFATVFGASPRPRFDLMVNDFIHKIFNKKEIALFEPNVKRNFVHIEDAAEAVITAIENDLCGVYNCGNTNLNMTKRDLAHEIFTTLGLEPKIQVIPGEDPDRRDYIVNNDKINKFVEFKRGIKDAVFEVASITGDIRQYNNVYHLQRVT